MRFTKNTQHDSSMLRLPLPRKMTMEVTKVLRLPRKVQLSFWKRRKKYCACHTKRRLSTADTWECHGVPRLPRKTALETVWEVLQLPPIETATPQENYREWRRNMISCKTSSNFHTLYYEIDVFRRVSHGLQNLYDLKIHVLHDAPVIFITHVTKCSKCHACHTICTLSALDAALTMRFAKYATRHVASAVPAAPATQNDDGGQRSAPVNATHLLKTTQKKCACHTKRLLTRYIGKRHEKPRRPCETSYATIETSKSDHFCRTGQRHSQTRTVANSCGKLRTVADGCETSIEYTLSTQTPRVTQEPLLRIREQDTLPSHALQEMPGKILRSFFLRFWKWHPQSELVSRDPVCKRSNLLQHWFHQPCKRMQKGQTIRSPLQLGRVKTTNKYWRIGIILPFLELHCCLKQEIQTCQDIQVLVKSLLSRFSVGTYPNIRSPAYPTNSLFWRGWIL